MNLAWLFYFFFAALLTSQSLMDLASTLMVITILVIGWRRRKSNGPLPAPRTGLLRIFTVWWFIILAGLLLNLREDTPWLKNFLEFRWIIEFYILAAGLEILSPSEKNFRALLPFVCFATAYAVAVYFLKYDPIHENWSDRYKQLEGYRTGGFFMNPMPFAHTFGALGVLLAGPIFFLRAGEWKKNTVWILATLLTLVAVILTFTRGIWIGMSVGLLAMGFLVRFRQGIAVLSGLLAAGVILFFSSHEIHERVLQSLHPTETYDSERLTIWKTNWLIFTEHPLLGVGYGENSHRLREYYDRLGVPKGFLESHAHNQYLHFLAGTGVLGLLCYLLVIGVLFRLHYLAYRNFSAHTQAFWKGLALGVLGAEICFYVGGVTESNFSIAKNRMFLVLIWALGVWLWRKSLPVDQRQAQ